MPHLSRLAALLLALAPACTSPAEPPVAPEAAAPGPGSSEARPPTAVRPWTTTFQEPAVLVARRITIEGPPGLREHLAIGVDPQVHDYTVRGVPEGMLQEVTVRPGAEGSFVRCYLDRLEIAAEEQVRVLERPADVPVRVLASGDAFWSAAAGGEQRGESLELVGQEPR